jgi:biopolymer transport protein ExbD
MKRILLILFLLLSPALTDAKTISLQEPSSNATTLQNDQPTATASQEKITKYTLSADRDAKARALAAVRLRAYLVATVYGFLVLLAVLWW